MRMEKLQGLRGGHAPGSSFTDAIPCADNDISD
jgi:hypothetical protein